MSTSASNRNSNVLDKLAQLELEMNAEAAGIGLRPDPQLSQLMSHLLSARYPSADLQIVVNSSRKTTTTKQVYETETPGMIGLDEKQLRELQTKLMEKISTTHPPTSI